MKKRVPIAIAAILSACGAVATTSNDAAESAPQGKSKAAQKQPQIGFPDFSRGGMAGCFDPSLSGYARKQAERIGGVPCEQKAGETETGGTSWVGEYRGPFDGATGVVTITNGRSGLAAEVVMFSDHGCGGSVSGPVAVQANRLILVKTPAEAEAPQCRIVMTRDSSSLNVTENTCTYYHGRSCEFNGRLTRVEGGIAPAKPTPARAPTWIVGAWVPRGQSCQGDSGLIIEKDGTYAAGIEENGKWALSGNALSLTALETFDADKAETERIENPQPVRYQVLSRSANAFSAQGPKSVYHYTRCW